MLRLELLNKLLDMKSSVDDITSELNKLGWDANEELVDLKRKHVINVLENYQAGKINEDEVEEWSNVIEVRDDIGREMSYENVINQVLYELANPYITEPLTKERAKILSTKLQG